jgi:folliculin
MNSMVCLGHFCEMHGPTAVLTTQMLPNQNALKEIPSLEAQQQQTCQACRLVLPTSPTSQRMPACMKTSGSRGVSYVSSRYPASQARFMAVRQACLRALSAEHVFNDQTPMMFSDSKIGTAAVLVFNVDDGSSRGQVRKYALICLGENETQLAHAWGSLVPQMADLAKTIKMRALAASDKENAKSTGNERFLRIRDVKQPARSLATILKDERIFVEVHARFAKMLALLAN